MGRIKNFQFKNFVNMVAGVPDIVGVLTSFEFSSPVRIINARSWFVYYSNASSLKPLAGVGVVGRVMFEGQGFNPVPDNFVVDPTKVVPDSFDMLLSEYPSPYTRINKEFNSGSYDLSVDAAASFGPVNFGDVIQIYTEIEYEIL